MRNITYIKPALVLALAATSMGTWAESTPNFKPSADIEKMWPVLADVQAVGRIKAIEPWQNYASFSPCTILRALDSSWRR